MLRNRIFIVSTLNRVWYLLFRVMRPKKVYYFSISGAVARYKQRDNFIHLTTDLQVEIFEESLVNAFGNVNSQGLMDSADYKITRRALGYLLNEANDIELEIMTKRLFHSDLYDRARKAALIKYVFEKNNGCRISLWNFRDSPSKNNFLKRNILFADALLRYVGSTILFLMNTMIKIASVAYFLRVVSSMKVRFKCEKRELDTMIVTYDKHDTLADIYKNLDDKLLSVGFLVMGSDVSPKYKKDGEPIRYLYRRDMKCAYALLSHFFIVFIKFYIKTVKIQNINVYKNIFVFFLKIFIYTCFFDNVKTKIVITNEDYSEFNPRYFIAKRNGCEIVNLLTSRLVPRLNPYISFCLIDKEISFSLENKDVLLKSGCRINRYINLNHFGGFLDYMRTYNHQDIEAIDRLLCEKNIKGERIISYYSTGNKSNLAYIDMPIATKLTVLEYLKEYIARDKGAVLIIKPHPGEKDKDLFEKEYGEIINLNNALLLGNSFSSYSLLEYSDINVADISTMGVHSRFFGFKTIIVNPFNIDVYFEPEERKSTLAYRYVTNKEDFLRGLDELGSLPKRVPEERVADKVSERVFEELIQYVQDATKNVKT